MKLTTWPRNAIGDRAGPRYRLQTFHLTLRACEPGATVNNTRAAIPILRQLFAHLDADQEHFILLALNNKLKVTGMSTGASSSGPRCCSARPR
jgi:hypothetical protein